MNKLLFDEGMEEMDRHIDKFFISYELESNSIHAPDGEYLLKDRTLDWTALNLYNKTDDSSELKDWFSKSKVIVRSGLIDLSTLFKCYREIQLQHNYHGRFIERYDFDGTYIEIGVGS